MTTQESCDHFFHQLPLTSLRLELLCEKCVLLTEFDIPQDIAGKSFVDIRKEAAEHLGFPVSLDEASYEQAREWVAAIKAQRTICGND